MIAIAGYSQQRISFTIIASQPLPIVADAGPDTLYYTVPIAIGGTPSATGGIAPYSYSWVPVQSLNDPAVSNPVFVGQDDSEFILTVTDSLGCISMDTIYIDVTTSVFGFTDESMKIYPVPATNNLMITRSNLGYNAECNVYLMDESGRVVESKIWRHSSTSIYFDISTLSNGSYILRFISEKGDFSKSIVIKH